MAEESFLYSVSFRLRNLFGSPDLGHSRRLEMYGFVSLVRSQNYIISSPFETGALAGQLSVETEVNGIRIDARLRLTRPRATGGSLDKHGLALTSPHPAERDQQRPLSNKTAAPSTFSISVDNHLFSYLFLMLRTHYLGKKIIFCHTTQI